MTDKPTCPECNGSGYRGVIAQVPIPCPRGCKPPEPEAPERICRICSCSGEHYTGEQCASALLQKVERLSKMLKKERKTHQRVMFNMDRDHKQQVERLTTSLGVEKRWRKDAEEKAERLERERDAYDKACGDLRWKLQNTKQEERTRIVEKLENLACSEVTTSRFAVWVPLDEAIKAVKNETSTI
jgi:Skp family chaperone for outer membrane proteins